MAFCTKRPSPGKYGSVVEISHCRPYRDACISLYNICIHTHVSSYMHIYIYMCVYIHIYTYIDNVCIELCIVDGIRGPTAELTEFSRPGSLPLAGARLQPDSPPALAVQSRRRVEAELPRDCKDWSK